MVARVCVVLPAWNEADAMPAALANHPSDVRIIVVDNGSDDGTADVARSLGVEVVSEPQRGFGAACKKGLDASEGAEVVVFMDADSTCDWADLDALTQPILDNQADFVLGRRVIDRRKKGSMPFHVGIAVAFLGWMCSRLSGVRVHDVPPYRAIRRESLVALDLKDRTFGWPLEMVLRAGQTGLRVIEVPVAYKVRVGTSKVTGTVKGTIKATTRMTKVLWQERKPK